MGGDRSTKHARIPPTREIFFHAQRGTAQNELGVHNGYQIDDDDEYAQIEMHIPHDYHGLYEAMLVFIPLETLDNMAMNIQTDYCAKNEVYNENSQGAFEKTVDCVVNCLQELDISDVLNGDASVSPIAAGDMVGFQVQRGSQGNTNILVLGIRFRYKIFRLK
jgi:hypothetical protein